MLLNNLMGAPLLAWLVDSLSAGGVERFFLVCRPPWEAAARACFPAGQELVVAEESQASEQIQVFLASAGDEQSDVIVVTANGEQVALGLGGYLDIGLLDTMKDLFVNFAGAVVFSVIGYFYVKSRGRGRFASRFIPKVEPLPETENAGDA